MAGPVVSPGEPSVVGIGIASRPEHVRESLSGFGVGDAGAIRGLDSSAALARVGSFFGMENQPLSVAPFVVEVPDGTLKRAARREARGGYIQGTNIIMMSDRAMNRYRPPEAAERTLVHELVHYVGFLGTGGQMAFNSGGKAQRSEIPEWLSEGMTQSFAELMLPSRHAPTYSYSYEVLASVLLEKIVGLGRMKDAFRTGDFRAVQRAVDGALGEGTFAGLLAQGDGGSAYAYLYGAAFGMRAGPGPVDEEGFLSDLRVRGAMRCIDLLQDPGFRRLADEAKSLGGREEPGARERLDSIAREIMERERLS